MVLEFSNYDKDAVIQSCNQVRRWNADKKVHGKQNVKSIPEHDVEPTIKIIKRTIPLDGHISVEQSLALPVKIEIEDNEFVVRLLGKGEKPKQLTLMATSGKKKTTADSNDKNNDSTKSALSRRPTKKPKLELVADPDSILFKFSIEQDAFNDVFQEIEAVQSFQKMPSVKNKRVFPVGPFLDVSPDHTLLSLRWELSVADSPNPWPADQKEYIGYKCMMARVLGDPIYLQPTSQIPERVTPELFYDNLVQSTDLDRQVAPFAVPGMTSKLLPFQRRTVNWCLEKEGQRLIIPSELDDGPTYASTEDLDKSIRDFETSPPLVWLPWKDDSNIVVNPYTGGICKSDTLRKFVEGQYTNTTANPYGGQGLIAEEMGLGKTVEVAALSLLHQRDEREMIDPNFAGAVANKEFLEYGLEKQLVWDPVIERQVVKSKTTLVIAPSSICRQWISELKAHAPQLSSFLYQPIYQSTGTIRPSIQDIINYDVVVTTYSVISKEIHSALFNPENRRTRSAKHGVDVNTSSIISPLVKIQFWRIILDEVQMVRTGVSPAARVAQLIPRVHAWGVTGTPVSHKMSDLRGILTFLRMYPFANDTRSWIQLMSHPEDFARLWTSLSIRHTASMVEDDLRLPKQSRALVTVQFGLIEQSNYDHLYSRFLEELGLNEYGEVVDDNGVACTAVSDEIIQQNFPKIRNWLVRLRQSCCHARIGVDNRRALGVRGSDTITQVLMAMIDQNEVNLLTQKRSFHVANLEEGQLYLEKLKERDKALEVFSSGLADVEDIVNSLRKDVRALQAEEEAMEDESEENEERRENAKKKRLRSWLEILHRYCFFIATCYFQLRCGEEESGAAPVKQESNNDASSNQDEAELKTEDQKIPVLVYTVDTEEVAGWREKESHFYERAEAIRKELLQEQYSKVNSLIENLKAKVEDQDFIEIQDMTLEPGTVEVGLASRFYADKVNELGEKLNTQAEVLDEWRESLISLLSMPLIDSDADPSGEEYEKSLDAQEYAYFYIEEIRKMVDDRDTAITGNEEVQVTAELSDFAKDLQTKRLSVMPIARDMPRGHAYEYSLASFVSKIKEAVSDVSQASESELLQGLYKQVRSLHQEAKQNMEALKKELNIFSDIFNGRIEYFKQLQAISDLVQVLDPEIKTPVKRWLKQCSDTRQQTEPLIKSLLSRKRYLHSLMTEDEIIQEGGSRECVICQEIITLGCITACGHHFCRDCLEEWLKIKVACPVCKAAIRSEEIYKFSHKPQLKVQSMDRVQNNGDGSRDTQENDDTKQADGHLDIGAANQERRPMDPIYATVPESFEKEMSTINLAVSYGSKLDTIVRHLIWLRQKNKHAQVVIFSQWREMLELLETALTANNIKFASVNRSRKKGRKVPGADEFKTDPSIACFLLHARSEAAGLTLVNATHVYLCEPLVNSGLEVQAVSRVHRIGQTHETIIWLFAIQGTVEEAVLKHSSQKRFDYLKSHSHSKPGSRITEHELELSNSHELAQTLASLYDKSSRGELVRDEDLRDLLFKPRPSLPSSTTQAARAQLPK